MTGVYAGLGVNTAPLDPKNVFFFFFFFGGGGGNPPFGSGKKICGDFGFGGNPPPPPVHDVIQMSLEFNSLQISLNINVCICLSSHALEKHIPSKHMHLCF